MNVNVIDALARQVEKELTDNILPFWMEKMVNPAGGFLPRIAGDGTPDISAQLGAVMNARILWAFSSAYRVLRKQEYLDYAERAKRVVIDRFVDKEYGGVYWSLNPDGTPLDTKKQIYALGFAIYGLSEFSRATGDKESLDCAISIYKDIEKNSFDSLYNGYYEAFSREWGQLGDVRLSEKDANDNKTMNTHLHIIEPYTNLYRVWPDDGLKAKIANLLDIFTDKILDENTGHLALFFGDDWTSHSDIVSYGHDIEASWLIQEAAEVVYGSDLPEKIRKAVVDVADAASEGYIPGGGMMYEFHRSSGAIDSDRHWWVQAEAVVGYLNAYILSGVGSYLKKATDTWDFISRHISDKEGGEWFWSLKSDGTPNLKDDKAGFWKCPYHNTRMCLEVIERYDKMQSKL